MLQEAVYPVHKAALSYVQMLSTAVPFMLASLLMNMIRCMIRDTPANKWKMEAAKAK